MNFMFKSLPLLLFSCLYGCNSEESIPSNEPTFIDVALVMTEGKKGEVSVTTTSNHTAYFEFRPGDRDSIQKSTSGKFTYTYSATGTYTYGVRAYTSTGRYREHVGRVSVIIEEATSSVPTEKGYSTPLKYDGYTLLWQDEFNGSSLNTTYWNYEIGDGCPDLCGWGNEELQYYQRENTTVENGLLTIVAREETAGNKSYTSSRLTTKDKFEFRYGRVDIRARLPKGQGIWPALWMLGANIDQVSWPACGEIDIMELTGGDNGKDATVHGTAHWDDQGHKEYGQEKKLSEGIFNDEFHVFSIIWTNTSIRWLLDDVQYNIMDTTPAALSEFQRDFFLIFNVAVGGNWPGSPNASTSFPQKMVVDYIRVFQKE